MEMSPIGFGPIRQGFKPVETHHGNNLNDLLVGVLHPLSYHHCLFFQTALPRLANPTSIFWQSLAEARTRSITSKPVTINRPVDSPKSSVCIEDQEWFASRMITTDKSVTHNQMTCRIFKKQPSIWFGKHVNLRVKALAEAAAFMYTRYEPKLI